MARAIRLGVMDHVWHVVESARFLQSCSILIVLVRNVTTIFGINVFNVTYHGIRIRTLGSASGFAEKNQFGRLCFGETFDFALFTVVGSIAVPVVIVGAVVLVDVVVIVIVVVGAVLTRR